MNRSVAKAIGVLLPILAVSACKDWLQGPGLSQNPNSPVGATAAQQLIAVQAAWTHLEGQLARNATVWTQQMIGSNNQQLTYATQYQFTEDVVGGQMTGFYTGGGLVGIRNVIALGTVAADPLFVGVGHIWEGFSMGMAASIWGDLPYSEAVGSTTTPKLDAQQAVYARVLAVLDSGITDLTPIAASTAACEASDVVFCATGVNKGTEASRWIRAAHTIKARFYLHLAERNGAASYTSALTEANLGINEVPTSANNLADGAGPGDFRSWHGATLDQDGNIWAEFLSSRNDLVVGDVLVQILANRNGLGTVDPRRARLIDANSGGVFQGRDRNNTAATAPNPSALSATRRALTFKQPIVTWAENQLIIAEAQCSPNVTVATTPHSCTGNAAAITAATTAVNSVRTLAGLAALGTVTLQDVMEEKFVAQFQNIDVWNDFKRTCVPASIRPYGTATEVPGRMVYAQGERSTNPNIPTPNAYPAGTTGVSAFRNWNDPNACP